MTLDRALVVVTFVAAIGAGLIAGVFFAFSTFVMRALARRPVAEGMAAMQAINVVVINPIFLGVFLGTAGLSLAAAVLATMRWQPPSSVQTIIAAALYVLGTFGVTVVCNVPLNNHLAAVSPSDATAAALWGNYVRRWTRWNHVRMLAGAAALVLFVLALRG